MWSWAVWCQASAICERFPAQLRPCGLRLSLTLTMAVRCLNLQAAGIHETGCWTQMSAGIVQTQAPLCPMPCMSRSWTCEVTWSLVLAQGA